MVHGALHLAEQWSAFRGRFGWLVQMRTTGSGPVAGLLELVVVVGYAAWLILGLRSLRGPRTEDPLFDGSRLARAHAAVARPAALVTAAAALLHAALLWLPRWLGHASHLESYELLRSATGTLPHLVLAALGLSAFSLHVAAGLPGALFTVGALRSAEARQPARLVSSGLGVSLFLLGVQLAGWHATGAGTVWPVRVVEPRESAPLEE